MDFISQVITHLDIITNYKLRYYAMFLILLLLFCRDIALYH
jgi:hypothetical protein